MTFEIDDFSEDRYISLLYPELPDPAEMIPDTELQKVYENSVSSSSPILVFSLYSR